MYASADVLLLLDPHRIVVCDRAICGATAVRRLVVVAAVTALQEEEEAWKAVRAAMIP